MWSKREAADGTTLQECNAIFAEETMAKRKEKFICDYMAEHLTAFLDGELEHKVQHAIAEAGWELRESLVMALAGMASAGGTKQVYAVMDSMIDSFLKSKAVEEFEKILQAEREAEEDLKATEGY